MNGENQGDTVLMLAKLFVALCLFIFVVVLGEDTFRSMFIEPTYSEEELLAKMEERKRLRNQDRLENWDLVENGIHVNTGLCLLYTSPSPRDKRQSRMPSSA